MSNDGHGYDNRVAFVWIKLYRGFPPKTTTLLIVTAKPQKISCENVYKSDLLKHFVQLFVKATLEA